MRKEFLTATSFSPTEKKNVEQIAEESGLSKGFVVGLMDEYGIERRSLSEIRSTEGRPNREELYKGYVLEEKSLTEMGEMYGVTASTVANWMKQEGIPRRSFLEAQQLRARKGKPGVEGLDKMVVDYIQHIAEGNDIDFETFAQDYGGAA